MKKAFSAIMASLAVAIAALTCCGRVTWPWIAAYWIGVSLYWAGGKDFD